MDWCYLCYLLCVYMCVRMCMCVCVCVCGSTKSNIPNLLNQRHQTKPTQLNLENQKYQAKHLKCNEPNKPYQIYLIKPKLKTSAAWFELFNIVINHVLSQVYRIPEWKGKSITTFSILTTLSLAWSQVVITVGLVFTWL